MMKLLFFIVAIAFVHISMKGYSQSPDKDIALLSDQKPMSQVAQKKKHIWNPLAIVYLSGIKVYQRAVSEQLASNCAFELTCSKFSKAMVNEYGFLKGYFLTFDRLGRCNAISPLETYPIRLNAKGKIIETTSDFHFH